MSQVYRAFCSVWLTLFDSTIREALGYCPETKLPVKPKVEKEAILEAEMVAFNTQDDRIDGIEQMPSI